MWSYLLPWKLSQVYMVWFWLSNFRYCLSRLTLTSSVSIYAPGWSCAFNIFIIEFFTSVLVRIKKWKCIQDFFITMAFIFRHGAMTWMSCMTSPSSFHIMSSTAQYAIFSFELQMLHQSGNSGTLSLLEILKNIKKAFHLHKYNPVLLSIQQIIQCNIYFLRIGERNLSFSNLSFQVTNEFENWYCNSK